MNNTTYCDQYMLLIIYATVTRHQVFIYLLSTCNEVDFLESTSACNKVEI